MLYLLLETLVHPLCNGVVVGALGVYAVRDRSWLPWVLFGCAMTAALLTLIHPYLR